MSSVFLDMGVDMIFAALDGFGFAYVAKAPVRALILSVLFCVF